MRGRACVPAERKATRSTEAVWPSNVRRHAPSASAHSRTVASPDAVATACVEHIDLGTAVCRSGGLTACRGVAGAHQNNCCDLLTQTHVQCLHANKMMAVKMLAWQEGKCEAHSAITQNHGILGGTWSTGEKAAAQTPRLWPRSVCCATSAGSRHTCRMVPPKEI